MKRTVQEAQGSSYYDFAPQEPAAWSPFTSSSSLNSLGCMCVSSSGEKLTEIKKPLGFKAQSAKHF